MKQITPEERIDAALESVLRIAGTTLNNPLFQNDLDNMRAAMRKIMSESYIEGSNASWRITQRGN